MRFSIPSIVKISHLQRNIHIIDDVTISILVQLLVNESEHERLAYICDVIMSLKILSLRLSVPKMSKVT